MECVKEMEQRTDYNLISQKIDLILFINRMQFTVSTGKAVFQTSLSKINLPGQDGALFCYWWMLRTGTAVLNFNIRSIGLSFLPVQHNFSQAKMNILVCFPCRIHYLPIFSSLCSKVGVHWPTPAKFNRQIELWAVLWNKDLGVAQWQKQVTFLEERLTCVTRNVRVQWDKPLLRISFAQSVHLTVHGIMWRQSHRNQPSWTPLCMGLLGLLTSFYFTHAILVNVRF